MSLLEPHSPYRPWHEERVEMLIELWSANVHHEQIADRLGVTSQSVIAKAKLLNLPSRASVEWPQERVDELTKLWAEGLSASQIGGIMNLTRNAVLGKVHRLHLPARATRLISDADRAARRAMFNDRRSIKQRISRVRTPRKESPPPEPVPEALMIPLLELQRNQCRFAVTESPYLFCGRPTSNGSWCESCARVVFRPNTAGVR
jgi:GcrA cell cycle regulator